jgi:predicted RNA methylase
VFWSGGPKELAALPGWNLRCHPSAYKVFLESQLRDAEQSAEFHNFVEHCSPSMLLFDIGASYGIFSLAAAHFGGTAIAIELYSVDGKTLDRGDILQLPICRLLGRKA